MGYFGDLYNKSLGDLSEFVGGIQNQSKLDQATESLPIEKISNDMEISSLRDFSSSFDISLPPETAHIVHYDNKEHLVESGELDLFSQKRHVNQKEVNKSNIRYNKGKDSNTDTELLSLAKGINDYKKQIKSESEIYDSENNWRMSIWR